MLGYAIEELLPLQPGGSCSADDINDEGVACGFAQGTGVTWEAGESVPSGLPLSDARAINSSRFVAGTVDFHAALFAGGQVHKLHELGLSDAIDINDGGIVVGHGFVLHSGEPAARLRPFIHDHASGEGFILDEPVHPAAAASGVNDSGVVVGYSWTETTETPPARGFLFRKGKGVFELDVITCDAINVDGVVTGSRFFEGDAGPVAYRLDTASADPTFDKIGPTTIPQPPYEDESYGWWGARGWDINADGVTVGEYLDPGALSYRAFVDFPPGSPLAGFHDLASLIIGSDGWELARASGINESGQIVGYGYLDSEMRGFRMTPSKLSVPDVAKVLARFVLGWLTLIGGVEQGGAGTGVTGGGKGVPIPPRDWFSTLWRDQSPRERNEAVTLAMKKVLSTIKGDANRNDLQRVLNEWKTRIQRSNGGIT